MPRIAAATAIISLLTAIGFLKATQPTENLKELIAEGRPAANPFVSVPDSTPVAQSIEINRAPNDRIRRLVGRFESISATGNVESLQAFLAELLEEDEALALEVLSSLNQNVEFPYHLSRTLAKWYGDTPVLEAINRNSDLERTQPRLYRRTTLRLLRKKSGNTSPKEVLDFILLPRNQYYRTTAAFQVADQLISANPDQAMDTILLFQTIEDPALAQTMLSSAYSTWVRNDPLAAQAYLNQTPYCRTHIDAISTLVMRYGKDDPSAAMSWIVPIDEPELRRDLFQYIAYEWKKQSSQAYTDWLDDQDPELRNYLQSKIQ
ncbi:MAG: hypothetical protein AAFX93_11195 [Verrucomicrobiota bacterium]